MIILDEQMGKDLVLVIDDDPLVLASVQQILEVTGWRALTAADGVSGIELFRKHQDEVGAVLLDMSMPGMSGTETFQALHQIDAGVKILLLSGHSEQELTGQSPQLGQAAFLRKPFDLDALVESVALILAAD